MSQKPPSASSSAGSARSLGKAHGIRRSRGNFPTLPDLSPGTSARPHATTTRRSSDNARTTHCIHIAKRAGSDRRSGRRKEKGSEPDAAPRPCREGQVNETVARVDMQGSWQLLRALRTRGTLGQASRQRPPAAGLKSGVFVLVFRHARCASARAGNGGVRPPWWRRKAGSACNPTT